MLSFILMFTLFFALADSRVRTSGRLIARPRIEKCNARPKHYLDKRTGHYYFFSGKTDYGSYEASWLDARNICREMCMDLVSLETSEENMMVEAVIKQYEVDDIWTSGRLCNFHGCDAPHLQPKNIKGWFWSGSGSSIPPTNETAPGWKDNPWSDTGFLSQFVSKPVPQPDNAEYLLQRSGVTIEACLSVQNNWYSDGIEWHDAACYRTKQFICEDSDVMMNFMKKTHPNFVLR
ncbi:uncharacterized protein LOC111709818 [Eurytemora carolleeae]|uniref:uncharacterized protein LOC111709818 n=1 Tax=Eurytemora carolleeae TaxID=1294199 RepID=UPI000C75C18D|nr:uncharacterized protein LOC111709818 [Eurytemora carolleeae]|eukprot:XP_023339500.1 uncharacterized protein LOC111709818 [Eurytemora affinis]